MKKSKNAILAIVLMMIFQACQSTKFIPVTGIVAISEYEIYVFQLCEYRNSYGNERYFLCTKNEVAKNSQIIEELYLLRSKVNPEKIIYITTKSDKYILRNRGIFNDSVYKQYIIAQDFEYVYFGKLTNNSKMDFVNAQEKLTFKINNFPNAAIIELDSMHNQTAIKNTISNKHLKLDKLFNVPIQFFKTDRTIVLRKKTLDPVKTIQLKDNRIIYTSESKNINTPQRKRLKYHPIYAPTNDSIVQKILKNNTVQLKAKAL
ncbi:MAG: hypothetical protein CL526_00635 [Aequorivita sp.]|nr:hypothetical protein [Aequorivita sp.]|tara:strand:- start:67063 stop:67845 length:783 start_codon:yes stop_codon:yes gene_type:complete